MSTEEINLHIQEIFKKGPYAWERMADALCSGEPSPSMSGITGMRCPKAFREGHVLDRPGD